MNEIKVQLAKLEEQLANGAKLCELGERCLEDDPYNKTLSMGLVRLKEAMKVLQNLKSTFEVAGDFLDELN